MGSLSIKQKLNSLVVQEAAFRIEAIMGMSAILNKNDCCFKIIYQFIPPPDEYEYAIEDIKIIIVDETVPPQKIICVKNFSNYLK